MKIVIDNNNPISNVKFSKVAQIAGIGPIWDSANAAYNQSNLAYTEANAAYNLALTSVIVSNTANAAYGQANLAYSTANLSYNIATAAYSQANAAYAVANSAGAGAEANALAAYSQANNAFGQANLAYDQANSAYNIAITKGGGRVNTFVQDSPPGVATPNTDFWWQSNTGVLRIYYNDANGNVWVDTSPPYTSNGGGSGNSGNSGIFDGIVGNSVQAASYNIGTLANMFANTGTVNNGTPVIIDSFPANQYNTIKYLIQLSSTAGIHSTEVIVMQDGVSTYQTEYATLFSANSLGSFACSISGITYNFTYTPYNPGSQIITYKMVRTAIAT